jgi:hypothetical protein
MEHQRIVVMPLVESKGFASTQTHNQHIGILFWQKYLYLFRYPHLKISVSGAARSIVELCKLHSNQMPCIVPKWCF